MRIAILTIAAMVAFAANSLLTRAALGADLMDPWSFTLVRLTSGAVALVLILGASQRRRPQGGSILSAAALFVYAAPFSLAYVRIPAGLGALLLFAAVQITMVGWAVLHGERPTGRQAAGLFLAIAGLAYLTLPGATAPDPVGAVLMLLAGIGWGAYSLRGRGSTRPLSNTAANFALSVPLVLVTALLFLTSLEAEATGIALAVSSGALASGGGYSLWYAAVPALGATRAATVQLSVPVIAAAGGILLLGEDLTFRLAVAGATIIGGIYLAVSRRRPPPG